MCIINVFVFNCFLVFFLSPSTFTVCNNNKKESKALTTTATITRTLLKLTPPIINYNNNNNNNTEKNNIIRTISILNGFEPNIWQSKRDKQ